MTRYVRASYDTLTNRWQLGKLGLPLSPVPLLRGDVCHLQVAFLNVQGDLSAYTLPLLMFKTYTNWLNGGDFTLAANTYDTSDPFHNLSKNQISIPFIVSYSMALDTFLSSVALFTMTGLKMETAVLRTQVQQAGYQGTETNIPSGTPGNNTFTVTIQAGQTSSAPVSAYALTKATGQVIAQLEGNNSFTPWSVVVSDGSFVITVPQAPDVLIPNATYTFTACMVHI